mmetsp:Transcript_112036/g.327644  ORF Transcript_112036/g.327644 Transcript_112036/m.327644 type:complete len:212 (-) Transcript_112036:1520-2155(-)
MSSTCTKPVFSLSCRPKHCLWLFCLFSIQKLLSVETTGRSSSRLKPKSRSTSRLTSTSWSSSRTDTMPFGRRPNSRSTSLTSSPRTTVLPSSWRQKMSKRLARSGRNSWKASSEMPVVSMTWRSRWRTMRSTASRARMTICCSSSKLTGLSSPAAGPLSWPGSCFLRSSNSLRTRCSSRPKPRATSRHDLKGSFPRPSGSKYRKCLRSSSL